VAPRQVEPARSAVKTWHGTNSVDLDFLSQIQSRSSVHYLGVFFDESHSKGRRQSERVEFRPEKDSKLSGNAMSGVN
jgi:hypothetical protein